MLKEISRAIRMLFLMIVVLGLAYPLIMTGGAQLLFAEQANGSLVSKNGEVVGSDLIGQDFSSEKYFHGRPSLAGNAGYDGAASGASNLGPTSQKLMGVIGKRAEQIRQENHLGDKAMIPSDLVTASGSGLDPHITLAAAQIQVDRVAAARGIKANIVQNIVKENIENPQFGFLGERRINVLRLNLALDEVI
ncbi:MAG: potassium-transporting ATPase subunit KdpC [Selenomonadaceae bacterium]